jgi:hypothetical protein
MVGLTDLTDHETPPFTEARSFTLADTGATAGSQKTKRCERDDTAAPVI